MAERTGFTLVLGGGGFPAHAYLSGVFASFADAGFEPRDAAHVVGTSAGALHAALIGAGCSAGELTHMAERFSQSAGERPFMRSWRGGADLALRTLGGLRVLAVLASRRKRLRRVQANPRWGLVETRDPQRYFGLMPVEWPEQRMMLMAYDLVDGRRRGLTGTDNLGLAVPEAVAASAALPGLMAPVRAGPHFLVDGGCASLTNLDAACGSGTLVTVCVAPMSFDPQQPPPRLLRFLYAKANRTLDHQAALVRADGQVVILIRPSARAMRSMGGHPLRPPDTARIAAWGRKDTARCLADPQARATLAAALGS